MSETKCQHCGGTYAYFTEQVKPDGTVSCQNCGRAIENATIVHGEPRVDRPTLFLEWFRASGSIPYLVVIFSGVLAVQTVRVLQSGAVTGWVEDALFILVAGLVIIGAITGSKIDRMRRRGRPDDSSTT